MQYWANRVLKSNKTTGVNINTYLKYILYLEKLFDTSSNDWFLANFALK